MRSEPKKDLSTLPRWARQEIIKLRADVESWKHAAHAATGAIKTNVHLHQADAKDGCGPGLPNDAEIVFTLPGLPTVPLDGLRVAHWPDQRIMVRHEQRADDPVRLHVYCPGGRLIVRPASSNVLYIEADPR